MEKAEFNRWLDYLDKIEAVNVTASTIKWPTQPEAVAN
nr:tail fiber assembly protein [Leminorella richardii]